MRTTTPKRRHLHESIPPAMSYEDIGTCLGISSRRVRQIEDVAMAKLRAALEADRVLGQELLEAII